MDVKKKKKKAKGMNFKAIILTVVKQLFKVQPPPQHGRAVATGSARAIPSGTLVPGRATQGGLVWHPAVLGTQPGKRRSGENPGGVCSGNRWPRVALSMRLWKICGKQGIFPGRTWDPSLNQIPKYLLQWALAQEEAGSTQPGWKPIQVQVSCYW